MTHNTLFHGSLFSGIGGFDLAAEWAGWTNVFNCEIDDFCQKVLKHNFPNAKQYGDIKRTNFSKYRGAVSIISAGFPCQPFSIAGKRKGTEDDRYLWDEMYRAIKEISPRWVVGENVLGIINWSKGLVFEKVCSDLEAAGYEVQPFVLPAAGVGAPHQRYRVWFVAFKNSDGDGRNNIDWEKESDVRKFGDISTGNCQRICSDNGETCITPDTESNRDRRRILELHQENEKEWQSKKYRQNKTGQFGNDGCERTTSNTGSIGHNRRSNDSNIKVYNTFEWSNIFGKIARFSHKRTFANAEMPRRATRSSRQKQGQPWRENERIELSNQWDNFPTKSAICGRNDGLPRTLDTITFPRWRSETIKAYGNAIVPQVAFQIFKTINEIEKL